MVEEPSKCNRMAKWMAAIFLAVVLCACLFVAVACNKHQHNYVSEVTSNPTCTENGVETFTCECGDSYTKEIPALGHTYTAYDHDENSHWFVCVRCKTPNPDNATVLHVYLWDEDASVPSTCTTQGKNVYKCVCGAINETTLPLEKHALAYNFNEEKHWQECENCDYKTAEVAHKYVADVTLQPTCTVKGETTYLCECEHSYTQPIDTIPHQYTKIVTTSANHWTECVTCGDIDPDHPKTPHSWQITGVKQQATCTADGCDFVKCSECDYESTQQTNKLGHNFENSVLVAHNANGHRLKCARCDEDVFISHNSMSDDLIGQDAECPDGGNRAATCGKAGHQGKICLMCGEAFHTSVPATGEHTPSEWVTTHGTEHWRKCEVCDAELERAFHTKEWQVTREPSCAQTGLESQVCTICGHVDNGGRTIDKLEHDYQPTGEVQEPTCTTQGKIEMQCSACSDITIKYTEKLGHYYGEVQSDANGHWKICSRCQYKDTGNHSFGAGTVIQQANTCGDTKITRYTCSYCHYNDDRTSVLQHVYSQVEESYVEGDCLHYTEYDERCITCGDVKHVVIEEYGMHNVVFFPKKDKTETETGNRSYWQCKICNKYFSSKDCHRELTADEIFDYAQSYIVLKTIDELVDAVLALENDKPSYDVYEITLEVLENRGYSLILFDIEEELIELTIVQSDISNIREGDIVTIKGHLILDDYDSYFCDAEIISVICSDPELFSMYLYVNDTKLGWVDAVSETGAIFYPNFSIPLGLMLGEKVTFTCYGYEKNAVLLSVLINGKACTTDENGQIVIEEVTGDITAYFVFDYTNRTSVKLNNINTGVWNGDIFVVNEYLAYQYVGSNNNEGRLYKDSSTRFFLNNANFTNVVIEYENYNIEQVIQNNIYVGADINHKSVVNQQLNSKTNKVTLTLDFASELRYFEYFASVSQARILSITFIYETNNTLANR